MTYATQPLVAKILGVCRLLLAVWSYIDCYDTTVRWAEMLPIFLIVAGIVGVAKTFRFSSVARVAMAVLVYLHTIGAHYTFERVPFDWFSDLFGFERNHFDRIAHFSVGLYAYAIVEYFQKNELTKTFWISGLFAVFAIFTVASVYEIIERLYAINGDPEVGIAFLGSQGDIRDAQKDMLADGLGAIVAVVVYRLQRKLRGVK